MFCSHCGARLTEGAKFCHQCGQAVQSGRGPAKDHPLPGKSSKAPLPPGGKKALLIALPCAAVLAVLILAAVLLPGRDTVSAPGGENTPGLEAADETREVDVPSASPTAAPSASPTAAPSASPTAAASASPTAAASASPTAAASTSPTAAASTSPTAAPSPTKAPTATPKPTKTLAASALARDPLDYVVTAGSVYIQDPVDFFGDALECELLSSSGSYYVRSFEGEEADLALLREYVETICSGAYNLKLTESYEQTLSSTFFSWGIDYVGTASVTDTTPVTYTDAQCTINIFGTIKRGDLEASVWIPQRMDQVDLGLRCGGETVELSLAGPSAMAGLYRYSDGSFETSDGRLRAALGQAVILRDGTRYTTEASFVRDSDVGRDELWARDYYRNETLFFCAPTSSLATGDVFTLKDLIQDEGQSRLNKAPGEILENADDFTSRTWTLFFGAGHDGDFVTPLRFDTNIFEDLTVRVMYYEEDVSAVYYIYARFDSAPYEVEALCAVDLSGGGSGVSDADEAFTTYVGQALSITCPVEYLPAYERFSWSVIEGSALVSLSGTVGRTCTVTATRAGTARLQVVYTYGANEPDVLTGINRVVERSHTYEYLITIQP